MADNAQTATQGQPGWLSSIDYVLQSAQRVAEGVVGFKLLNSEADAKAAQARWQAATYTQLANNPGAAWSGAGGMGGIQLPGVTQAGVAGGSSMLLLAGFGLLAFLALKD